MQIDGIISNVISEKSLETKLNAEVVLVICFELGIENSSYKLEESNGAGP